MEFNTIRFEEPEPGIGLITLNRPDRLNAIIWICSMICIPCFTSFAPWRVYGCLS